ncbi:MAG TPA: NmrA/HSCARG family protein [Myxococcaceae bacterium]|nr:NmrA/HSCARG family protein [Myxococcaceae bacterium]
MASKKPVIAVVGATGAQGSGLVRAILQDPEKRFTARAITRKPDSEKARALAAQGAEVVAADADDAASLDRAFAGATGAFCVTNFWEHFSADREVAQARAMAKAAARADVRHLIWSTLEDTRLRVPVSDDRMPTLHGRYKVPHFDGKGEADAVFAEAKVPHTLLLTSFYWDNFIHFGLGPRKDASGQLVLALPMGDKKLPGIAAEDIGPCAFGIFTRGQELVGRTVGIAGEHLTGAQMAAEMSSALGQPVRYHAMAFEQFRKLGFPGADDLGNMFQYKHDFEREFTAARPVDQTRALYPGLLTFRQWLARYAKQIPLS